ncbi:HAD-IA family hydrolase [Stenotrophomonas maltophilia]|uniref:HAD-IA family hydrolase n=1 Tax=Stenotrophomonas maltophilia TaxID=40324 RepID=UPI0039C488F8
MPTLHCKALLLDVDGTLIDSLVLVEHVLGLFSTKHGLDYEEVRARAHGMQTIDLVRHYLGDTDAARQEAKMLERYEEEHVEGIVATPGAAALLRSLPPHQVALVTSAGQKLARNRMNAAGLQLPTTAVFAEDANPGKPNPFCYQLGAKRLGLDAKDCVVIEDARAGIEAGLAAGAIVLNVGPRHPEQSARVIDIASLEDLTIEVIGDSLNIGYVERNTNP